MGVTGSFPLTRNAVAHQATRDDADPGEFKQEMGAYIRGLAVIYALCVEGVAVPVGPPDHGLPRK